MSEKDDDPKFIPTNWIKMRSKSRHGMYYYFNTLTNQSRWTPPTLTPEGSPGPDVAVQSQSSSDTASVITSRSQERCRSRNGDSSLGIKKTEAFKSKANLTEVVSKHYKKIVTALNNVVSGPEDRKNGRMPLHRDPFQNKRTKEQVLEAKTKTVPSPAASRASINQNPEESNEENGMEWELTGDLVVTALQELRQQAKPEELEMECDEFFSLFSMAKNVHGAELNIVIDTNVFLANLQFVTYLLGTKLPEWGQPRLVIPWVVLQELDYLKAKKGSNGRLQLAARMAGALIHTSMTNKHPFLTIQTAYEASEAGEVFFSDQADDKILHCAISLVRKGRYAVLLSNDLNLCSKALAHDVKAYKWESLLEGIRTMSSAAQKTTTEENARENALKLADRELVEQIGSSLRESLSKVLEFEMKAAFQELWKSIVLVKPPWIFSDIVRCIDKHWIAVFGMVYSKHFRDVVNDLQRSLHEYRIFLPSVKDGKELFDTALSSLKMVAKVRKELAPFLEAQIDIIKEAYGKWERITRGDSDCLDEKKQIALNFFQFLWHRIFSTCAEVLYTLEIPISLEYHPTGSLTPFEAQTYLISLRQALINLHNSMAKFLKDTDQVAAREFAHSLFACVNAEVIIMSEDTLPAQNVQELAHALLALASDESGRAKMGNGLGQLQGFHDLLPNLTSVC